MVCGQLTMGRPQLRHVHAAVTREHRPLGIAPIHYLPEKTIIEVGYGSDTRDHAELAEKNKQHQHN